MSKIAINPNRLKWCCDTLGIDVYKFYQDVHIAENTISKALENKPALSVNQLEKIADYFNRSLLFFLGEQSVVEEKIYSPQFRTINNQRPIHSRKLRKFINNVEAQREVYLGLLEDLNIPIIQDWRQNLNLTTNNIKQSSHIVRQWLGLQLNHSFEDLRLAVENKGIMVIVSNGYNGVWQIDKQDLTRGFCLNYDTLPVIAIKKQSKGAQAFTLMHELAHLLLHKTSMMDNEQDFYAYQGTEQEASAFASNVLMPDEFIANIDLDKLQNLEVVEYDNFLKKFKEQWCVSGDAILYRLFREQKITQNLYQAYRDFKEAEKQRKKEEEEGKKLLPNYKPPVRMYRHREPINMFGRNYVATVLDAHQNKHITLSKASTYLDNLKIHTLHKLEQDFV
jgi:Zn-dependent peptidase ImmA (M78 family)/transcriptional regulator with XRE-family HTH domain